MHSNRFLKYIPKFFINFFLIMLSITCIFPFIWLVYSSLKTESEFALNIVSLPKFPQLSNYIFAIEKGKLGTYFFNSLLNSVISVVFVVILAFIIGYCLSRFDFRGNRFLYILFLSGMLMPVYALLIPIFVEFKSMNLINKQFTLILPYIGFQLPMTIFLVESFVKTIPVEIEEAAYMDGCTMQRTMFEIIMPICSPVLATSVILTFLNNWNEFPLALILLNTDKFETIPVGLTNFVGEHTTDYPLMMAALVIATIPVIIIYFVFYKQIINGMVAGAVKG